MHTQIYRVKGMHCASCASIIEKTFKKTEGVSSVEVNYGTEKAKVSFDGKKIHPRQLSEKIEPLGYSLDLSHVSTEDSHMHHGRTAEEMGMSAEEHAVHTGIGQS